MERRAIIDLNDPRDVTGKKFGVLPWSGADGRIVCQIAAETKPQESIKACILKCYYLTSQYSLIRLLDIIPVYNSPKKHGSAIFVPHVPAPTEREYVYESFVVGDPPRLENSIAKGESTWTHGVDIFVSTKDWRSRLSLMSECVDYIYTCKEICTQRVCYLRFILSQNSSTNSIKIGLFTSDAYSSYCECIECSRSFPATSLWHRRCDWCRKAKDKSPKEHKYAFDTGSGQRISS